MILHVVSGAAPTEPLADAEAEHYLRRAEALRLALTGDSRAALRELDRLWTASTTPVEMMSDVAWVYVLARQPDRALRMVAVAARSAEAIPPVLRRALAASVHAQPSLAPRAFAVALRRGPARDRVKSVAAVARALAGRTPS